ncbi:MAG: hypothetical protein IJV72_02215 [Clostridia bacterium]|nr:hypothetical protein [Clostridia bacterium]
MKNGYSINIRLSEDMMRKLIYISQAENRSPSNQFNFMLRNNIAYFERTKGKISDAKLREIDISEYAEESKEK